VRVSVYSTRRPTDLLAVSRDFTEEQAIEAADTAHRQHPGVGLVLIDTKEEEWEQLTL